MLGRRPPGVFHLAQVRHDVLVDQFLNQFGDRGDTDVKLFGSSESVHSPLTAMCAMMLRLMMLFLCVMPFRASSSCLLKNSVSDVILPGSFLTNSANIYTIFNKCNKFFNKI